MRPGGTTTVADGLTSTRGATLECTSETNDPRVDGTWAVTWNHAWIRPARPSTSGGRQATWTTLMGPGSAPGSSPRTRSPIRTPSSTSVAAAAATRGRRASSSRHGWRGRGHGPRLHLRGPAARRVDVRPAVTASRGYPPPRSVPDRPGWCSRLRRRRRAGRDARMARLPTAGRSDESQPNRGWPRRDRHGSPAGHRHISRWLSASARTRRQLEVGWRGVANPRTVSSCLRPSSR